MAASSDVSMGTCLLGHKIEIKHTPVALKLEIHPTSTSTPVSTSTPINPHVCGSCGKTFSRKDNKDRHTASFHRKTSVKCKRCPKLHSSTAHGPSVQCEICFKSFSSIYTLKKHKQDHDGNFRSNLPDLSHAVRSQLMSPAKWYLNAFTPCQNCRNYFSTKQLIFKPREFLPRNVRRFIKRSDKGQGSSGLSKLNGAPVHVGNGGRSLVRPFFFTLGVCGVSFTGAMIWQYETMRYHAQKLLRPNPHTEHIDLRKFGFREHIGSMWNGLSRGQKMVAGIIGANFLVFLMWRVPVLTPFMTTYFCSSPVSGAPCVSMVLSQFSHINFFHLAANMYVLWSFSSVALSLLGKEQFMALYLSAGTVSCFSSYVLKVARKSFTPSVGASGALMAVLGAVCVSYPDARLAVAFIGDLFPHSFSADTAMKALIAVDTTGLVLGWKLFDHAAHLGGMLFGILYMKFGRDLIWGNREPVMEAWHKLRGKP